MNVSQIINKLWTSSPSEIVSVLKNRLLQKKDWDYSLAKTLNSKKHMNAQYLIDRWERYWRVIKSNNHDGAEKYFEFQNKNIMELGCGPVFGWGPIAIFRGANTYYYYEPALIRNVVESNEIKEKYFFHLYKELVANFGNNMGFDEYYESVITKCMPVEFTEEETVDLILSNSVLEHIPENDIHIISAKLFSICKIGGHLLHCVDFGSHGFGGQGFGSLYTYNSKKDLKNLNLLRASDIENLIVSSGFQLLHSTVYHSEEINKHTMNPKWKAYSDKDLTSRVVIFVGKKVD